MIKKLAIAAFVALTFVIYSIHQRNEGSQATSLVTNQPSTPTSTSVITPPANSSSAQYKDGAYTGKSSDAYYGYVQVKAIVSGGRITDIQFIDYPQDRRNSVTINEYAAPQLKQQAIQAQSAQVDGVSGATDTSQAFMASLSDALKQAQS